MGFSRDGHINRESVERLKIVVIRAIPPPACTFIEKFGDRWP